MANNLESYESIKAWREKHIYEYFSSSFSLNEFHDRVMKEVIELAIIRIDKGDPPCDFCWFITGSGGRFEQGLISDQDHGMIFEINNQENESYFLELGKEISDGLALVGFPYCKGNIMSSNQIWCKSLDHWTEQLFMWMEEGSLDSIRNLQIFYDARCLSGIKDSLLDLKYIIFDYQKNHPFLLKRFMDSVMHIKKAIGPLGQIILEEKGKHHGSINLKYSAFLPYVNAIRILAIKEGIYVTSTLDRIDRLKQISEYSEVMSMTEVNFQMLLNYRLSLFQVHTYEDTHYLKINNLTRSEKKEIKRILKDGIHLHHFVSRLINKGC